MTSSLQKKNSDIDLNSSPLMISKPDELVTDKTSTEGWPLESLSKMSEIVTKVGLVSNKKPREANLDVSKVYEPKKPTTVML